MRGRKKKSLEELEKNLAELIENSGRSKQDILSDYNEFRAFLKKRINNPRSRHDDIDVQRKEQLNAAYLMGCSIINTQSKIIKARLTAAAVNATTSNVANTPVNNSAFITPSVAASDVGGEESASDQMAMATSAVTAEASATCLNQWSLQPSSENPPPEAHHEDMVMDMSEEYDVSAVYILKMMRNTPAETAMSNAGGIESTSCPLAMEMVEDAILKNTLGDDTVEGPRMMIIGDGGSSNDGGEQEPTITMTKQIPLSLDEFNTDGGALDVAVAVEKKAEECGDGSVGDVGSDQLVSPYYPIFLVKDRESCTQDNVDPNSSVHENDDQVHCFSDRTEQVRTLGVSVPHAFRQSHWLNKRKHDEDDSDLILNTLKKASVWVRDNDINKRGMNQESTANEDSDTSEDKNNSNNAEPTKFIFSSKDSVEESARLTTEADENGLFFRPNCTSFCITHSESTDMPCWKRHANVVHAPLNRAGQYVLFPATTFHRGYYNNQEKTFLTAQLFAVIKSSQSVRASRNTWNKNQYYQVQGISPEKLCELRKDLIDNWDEHYPSSKYPPPEQYKNTKIDTNSNRFFQKKHFTDDQQLHNVKELVDTFEYLYPQLEIKSVWFIKKSRGGDGFQRWHQDLVGNGTVAATIVLNIDSLVQQPQLTTEADATNLSASEDPTVTGDSGPLVIENGSSALGTGGSDSPANSLDMELKARDMVTKLMRPLTPEDRNLVENAMKDEGEPSDILARQGADSVQRQSMQTLRPKTWLNDEVINYFWKNCLMRRDEKMCERDTGRKRSHFFSTYFIQTMFNEKNNDQNLRGTYNYRNVERWSNKVPGEDIFNLKYILCPINHDNIHWTSAVIFMEDKRIQYYDSMGSTGQLYLEGLLTYVKDEYRTKNGKELNTTEWELVPCTKDTPRQKNGYDCGVFTCMFADFISKDCSPVFNQYHINHCRYRIALSIIKNCAIDDSGSQAAAATVTSTESAEQAVDDVIDNDKVGVAPPPVITVTIIATTKPALSDEKQNVCVATPQDDASVEVMGKKSPASTDNLVKYAYNKQSVSGRTRSGKSLSSLVTEADSKTLLIYPFDAEEAQLSEAASGLKELGGDLLGFDDHGTPLNSMIISPNISTTNIGMERSITVREDDKTRLEKGIWLNDTLVDFWMRWISRGEPQQQSNVQFFSSHLMTIMKDTSIEAASKWIKNKNIEVFEKKLLFFPINADSHWSLGVVVNPGLIENGFDNDSNPDEEIALLLHFDSLSLGGHDKNTYTDLIYNFLNCEWNRHGHTNTPFGRDSMPSVSPKKPMQLKKGGDCGIYVCRCAYSLYVIRQLRFTWDASTQSPPFNTLIVNGPTFLFDVSDIIRIRDEIKTLIDKLSVLYFRKLNDQSNADRSTKKRFPKFATDLFSKNKMWKANTIASMKCNDNYSTQIECNDNCEKGKRCSNKCIQNGIVKNVFKTQKGEKGFGLVAGEDIKHGEYVIEYIGRIVRKDPDNTYTMKYQYFDLWVDASEKLYDTCLAKYINHSCNPNCENLMWAVKGRPRLCFFATRDIKMGEEITFDYGWTLLEASLSGGHGTKCLCGEKDCRGTIERAINGKRK